MVVTGDARSRVVSPTPPVEASKILTNPSSGPTVPLPFTSYATNSSRLPRAPPETGANERLAAAASAASLGKVESFGYAIRDTPTTLPISNVPDPVTAPTVVTVSR